MTYKEMVQIISDNYLDPLSVWPLFKELMWQNRDNEDGEEMYNAVLWCEQFGTIQDMVDCIEDSLFVLSD